MSNRHNLEFQLKLFSGKAKEVLHKLLLIAIEKQTRKEQAQRPMMASSTSARTLDSYGIPPRKGGL